MSTTGVEDSLSFASMYHFVSTICSVSVFFMSASIYMDIIFPVGFRLDNGNIVRFYELIS